MFVEYPFWLGNLCFTRDHNPGDTGTNVTRTHNQQNEVTGVGAATLAFDKNGNMTTDEQGRTLVYDAWNRLVAVKNGGTTLASYKFDGTGRRIVETAGANTRDLYFDGWNVLEERLNGATTADIQYIWSPVYVNALILRDRSTAHNGTLDERLWVQQDANLNVTALINGSGTVVERYVYDPYGLVTYLNSSWSTISSSAYAANYLFESERLDTATGLFHMDHRDYSPTLGRWVSVDPLGFKAGDNDLYRFVGDSAIDHTDPAGLTQGAPLPGGSTLAHNANGFFVIPPPAPPLPTPWQAFWGSIYDGFDTMDQGIWMAAHDLVTGPIDIFGYTGDAIDTALFNRPLHYKPLSYYGQASEAAQQQGTPWYSISAQSGLNSATWGLSGLASAANDWIQTGDPRGYQQYVGAFGVSSFLGYAGTRPGAAVPGVGPRGICFVAGTEILTSDLDSTVADAKMPSEESRGALAFLIATASLVGATILGGCGLALIGNPKRRRRLEEDAEVDDLDDKSSEEDEMDALETQRPVLAPSDGLNEAAGSQRGGACAVANKVGERGTDRMGSTQRPGMRKKVLSGAVLAACLLCAGLFTGQAFSPSTEKAASTTQKAQAQPSRSIETIRVGQRVLTQNAKDRSSSVDVNTWRLLRLEADNSWDDGTLDVIEVETLQSRQWVETQSAEVGALVPLPLDLVEMGLPADLKARVVANEPCPVLEDGPGRVVLTTVNHLNNDLWEIGVSDAAGSSETIRPTGLHKFYSVTRAGWISARDLEAGEELKGVRGPVYVDNIRALPGVQRVYNMTVEGEHVYRVSSAGVLVHNNGCAAGNTVLESPTYSSSPGNFSFSTTARPVFARPPLPPFNGKPQGVFFSNEGHVVPLQTGNANPTYGNYISAGHVEGQAAVLIRQNGLSGGAVFHNHPFGTCNYCNTNIPTLLPENATLDVFPPPDAVAPSVYWQSRPTSYTGNGNTPKPNLRQR